ncbi:Eukaryotic translation initiation factor 3 subunit M, partial [Varanus komodoensis]
MDEFQLLRPDDVDKVLGQVRPTTCLLDPCPSWLLKKAKDGIGTWILEVVNASLRDGWVPSSLKEAVVRPVLKKASLDPDVAVNYRPVANILFLGKVLERVVAGQLQAFLDETDYLDPFQSGFRPGDTAAKVMVELLGSYTEDNASQARVDAHRCIVRALKDPNTFLFDHLLTLKPVKFLEGELIHDLLTIFVSAKLASYVRFYQNNKDFIDSLGLLHEQNMAKMRLLTFMGMAVENKEISFDTMQQELQIGADDVEAFVIDGRNIERFFHAFKTDSYKLLCSPGVSNSQPVGQLPGWVGHGGGALRPSKRWWRPGRPLDERPTTTAVVEYLMRPSLTQTLLPAAP